MSVQLIPTQLASTQHTAQSMHYQIGKSLPTTALLSDGHEEEVLAFLAENSLHTTFLAGYVRDNGLVSPRNRGSFYAYRNYAGNLEGVALIGRATLIEARTERALAAFAKLARANSLADIIIGERNRLTRFWDFYAENGEAPRLVCPNLLLERRLPITGEGISELRLATPDDLSHIVTVNAEMFVECSGVNPLVIDPAGFHQRALRRIEKGRVWVWTKNGSLVFKVDVIAETPEATYIEGVYVNPQERGQGHAGRCLAQLCRNLLARSKSICLLVEEQNTQARDLYRKAGFEFRADYQIMHFKQRGN